MISQRLSLRPILSASGIPSSSRAWSHAAFGDRFNASCQVVSQVVNNTIRINSEAARQAVLHLHRRFWLSY
eukprot:COSAG06_NODE_1032_length_11010_cov_13.156448_7_plen_71_part_00